MSGLTKAGIVSLVWDVDFGPFADEICLHRYVGIEG